MLGANRLAEQLNKDKIPALAIHGNKSQGARTRALSEFKDASLQVLVATDIAARGLDIVDLPHVINYELPNIPEDYIHRIGRTGRAGSTGEAISLVCIDEYEFLADIERLLKRQLPRQIIPGFELDPNDKAEVIEMGGVRGRNQSRGGARVSHGSSHSASNSSSTARTAGTAGRGVTRSFGPPSRSGAPQPSGGMNGMRRAGGRGR